MKEIKRIYVIWAWYFFVSLLFYQNRAIIGKQSGPKSIVNANALLFRILDSFQKIFWVDTRNWTSNRTLSDFIERF